MRRETRMNETETIDYLTDELADAMTETEQHVAVIGAAVEYGYRLDPWEQSAYDYANQGGHYNDDDNGTTHKGDPDDDVETLARWSMRYLNENGIVPRTYEHGQRDTRAGTGSTARGDGAARLYGAQWVTA